MKLKSAPFELRPRRVFRIARARRREVQNVFLTLEAEGVEGIGEASPNAFYAESADGVLGKLAAARRWLGGLSIRSLEDIAQAWQAAWEHVAPSRAAQCAIDLALWDWLARKEKVSVCELATGRRPRPVPTFCTVGLSEPQELEEKIAEVRAFPFIKIKSDPAADLAIVRLLRERSHARLAVDANGAWGGADLPALCAELGRLGVLFLEQPLAPGQDGALSSACAGMPVMADESCVQESDLGHAAAHYAGFNIKLVKCGGITPALRMARHGRERGLLTMTGCMLESSVLIAAGAAVAQQTDFADLDGAWLLANDPAAGWRFEAGLLHPTDGPGLGVEPGPELRAALA